MFPVEISGTPIVLFCLVRESNAPFKVTLGINNDISDFKKLIRNEKQNDLATIDIDNIKLWKLNDPVSTEYIEQLQKITFQNNNNVTLLDVTNCIVDYWAKNQIPSKKRIHVIVEINEPSRKSKRSRLVRAFDGEDMEQVFHISQKIPFIEQIKRSENAFDELPKIIDNGRYALGESVFLNFISSGVFVDKSLFIMEFMIYGDRASLITRPRRFGKSTNLSMLYTFLKPPLSEKEKEFRLNLFKDLKISHFDWFIKLNFGNWPVIHVSFKDLDDKSWNTMINTIKNRISNLYKEHSYILSNKELLTDDEDNFKKIMKGTISRSHLINSLSSLARYLNLFFGISTIILIDEYDWPMEHAGNFYKEANSFFRSMYSSVTKDNPYVYKILFVGLLPLGQATFLSGLNNVVAYPMHNPPNNHNRALFSDTFGFTELEVKFLLKEKELTNKHEDLRFYYNGYKTITDVYIYNPHSVISYLSNNNKIDDYWTNSGPTTTLLKYLKNCGPNIIELLDNVLFSYESNISVNVELQNVLQYDIFQKKPKIDAIYTLLYYSGYLSVKNMKDKLAELVIPNEEVASQWRSWIFEIIGIERVRTNEIYESLFDKNIKKFCEQFPSLYMDMVSCYDIADFKRSKLYETWYHLFILGTLATFHGIEYQVLSNRETGNGRPDIRIIPLNENKDTSIILEFKLAKSDDCNEMVRSAKEGLNQIVDKKYRANIPGHVKVIVEVAIAFHKKSTFVSARLLKRKKDGLSANHTWEEVASSNTNNFSKDNGDDEICKGITITNDRCKRTVKFGDYCYQHRN